MNYAEEKRIRPVSGFAGLAVFIAILLVSCLAIISVCVIDDVDDEVFGIILAISIILICLDCILTAGLAALWRYALAQHKRQKALETGVQALLRDRIIQSCDYYQKKQSISVHGRENIQSMYAAYHALGGNGVGAAR